MSAEHRTTPPQHCVVTIEKYGSHKYDCVLFLDGQVIERTEFDTLTECNQFIRLMQRAGHRYMPPASGGSGQLDAELDFEERRAARRSRQKNAKRIEDLEKRVAELERLLTMRPARGGAPVDELPTDEEPNGPIGFAGGEYIWPDYGYPAEGSMIIDAEVAKIDADSIPF